MLRHVGVEGARIELDVVADRRLVGEARRVGEQHPDGDPALGVLLEDTVDGELGQIGGDGLVQLEEPVLGRNHHRRRGEHLRHRLDAEGSVRRHRSRAIPFQMAEALGPQHLIPVDNDDRQSGNALLGHELRNPRLVPRDHGGRCAVASGGDRRRVRREHRNSQHQRQAGRGADSEPVLVARHRINLEAAARWRLMRAAARGRWHSPKPRSPASHGSRRRAGPAGPPASA